LIVANALRVVELRGQQIAVHVPLHSAGVGLHEASAWVQALDLVVEVIG
jgi:hypothetical protein